MKPLSSWWDKRKHKRSLYAQATPNNSTAKILRVFDDNGTAFIHKVLLSGQVFEWHAAKWTAAEWVELNRSPRNKWQWTIEVKPET